MGNARPIDGRPQSEVQVGPDKLEVVASFCYLGDMLSAGGGCEMAVTTCVKTAWKTFRELLPVLTSHHLSYKTRGHVYSSCVHRPVYIESRVCVVEEAVMCSFEYLCVVYRFIHQSLTNYTALNKRLRPK